jgi:membrane-bound metal-dependent hydrolase YbcI (DUF457 family)
MMGRQHGLTGVLAAAGTAHVLKADVPMFVLLCTTLPGTALLPDIDHPDSTVSSTYGPITGLLSKVLDHRKQTHSVPGILIFSTAVALAVQYAGTWTSYENVTVPNMIARGFLAVVLILIWSSSLRLFKIKGKLDDFAPIPFAALITYGEPYIRDLGINPFPFKYLPYMVALGMLVHVIGDVITKQAFPLWWPFSDRKTALGLFRAGGRFEMWVMLPLIIVGTGTEMVFWIMEIV